VINAVVSPVPQGPWSDPVTVYNCTMGCYGPAAQPYFDPSGKTLILDVSIWAAQFYTQTASVVCFLLWSPGLPLLTKSFRHSIELRGFLSDGFHKDDSLHTLLYSIYISIIKWSRSKSMRVGVRRSFWESVEFGWAFGAWIISKAIHEDFGFGLVELELVWGSVCGRLKFLNFPNKL